jgi:hypothetical protein
MDPRVKATPGELRQQFVLARDLAAALEKGGEALEQLRAMRGRIAERRAAGAAGPMPALDSLDSKLATVEGAPSGTGPQPPDNLARVVSDLGQLYGIVDGTDGAPTTQTVATIAERRRTLDALLVQWNALRTREIR